MGAFASLVALRHAERTGEGQVVDVNLLESMLNIMGPLPSAWIHLGYLQPRLGSGMPYTIPRGTYRCADGVWVAVSASAQSVAGRVLSLIGLANDDRFQTFQDRFENREHLESLVAAWIRARPSVAVIAEFERVDAAIARVYDMSEVVADDHVQFREPHRCPRNHDAKRCGNYVANTGRDSQSWTTTRRAPGRNPGGVREWLTVCVLTTAQAQPHQDRD